MEMNTFSLFFADAIIASTKFHAMYKFIELTTHLKTVTSSLILKILEILIQNQLQDKMLHIYYA